MKITHLVVILVLLAGSALATRPWTELEFRDWNRSFEPAFVARPESLIRGPRRYNYLERIKLMADFVASYQVSDSGSPHFGGIIESEHQPNIIETDNTQEAIWVWSRWYELTGRDDYRENIRRAWSYVLDHPAWEEHGGQPASVWYAVWNCGLGFMSEACYRRAYGDSSFLAYADSCRLFYLANPLDTWNTRDNFVTSQSSGMAYKYALEFGDQEMRDTALARGTRVRSWIEADSRVRLAWASWAMSGGTAFWGVANTVCREDTAAGRVWLETYQESLPGFYPSGTWNCSHNIWLANACRAAAELTGTDPGWLLGQYLLDTLLTRDTDRDGGIPATWTDPETQDQTWVSTYLDFMMLDALVTPVLQRDVSCLEFVSPTRSGPHVLGDTLDVLVPLANAGLADLAPVSLRVFGPGYDEQQVLPALDFLAIDTVVFPGFVPAAPGEYELDAITTATSDQNPLNDSAHTSFKVYGRWNVTGTLLDSATAEPIPASVLARIAGDAATWDSCVTDSLGRFGLTLLDTLYDIAIRPDPPWYERTWTVDIPGDTTLDLRTQPAHVMVVSTDPQADHAGYYTSTLDTLGVTSFTWHRSLQGAPDWSLVDRLRTPTVIWYSGDADSGTVPAADQDSLLARAASGINLLLTGQDIAEELGACPLLDLCGVSFDSSGWSRFFVFPQRADSLGALLEPTATAGGDGANNQRSRDILSPLRNGARLLMVYDTVTSAGAAVRREDPGSGTRTVFLGFGFEAVNRPQSRPDYFTRVQMMERLLGWLQVPTGIAEPRPGTVPRPTIIAHPNPFRSVVRFEFANLPTNVSTVNVYDASGRSVAKLSPSRAGHDADWDGHGLPAGVYFVGAELAGLPPLRVIKVE
ncbi:T9SS type A sorting domain-containing protein [candidate division WOR-3 bacterium]|nr:T9SS type A sorting domain-containing protein [candidate division WOR-3 bacterium]